MSRAVEAINRGRGRRGCKGKGGSFFLANIEKVTSYALKFEEEAKRIEY